VLLTERTVKAVGFERPEDIVGQEIAFGNSNDFLAVVVGVVSDFHQHSLREGYKPILFMPAPGLSGEYFTVRMEMHNAARTMRHLEYEYDKAFPGNEFSYFFLDEFFDRQYAADQQFEKVFGLFAGLSLVVTCLGLFGLSSFAISQRIREIVIRRVFGATLSSIVYLLSLDFLRLVILTNIVALPVSIFLVNRWLENFAFRVPLSWMIFAVPAVVLAFMSVATLSVQAVKTSRKTPGIVLKTE
jgi:putative ABC transport system permease protein